MGNNPSKVPASPRAVPHPPPQNQPTQNASNATSSLERKVNRRVSIQALAGGGGAKSSAADPSASSTNATGQPVTNKRNSLLQERLQSCSPDIPSPRSSGRPEKSEPISTRSEGREKELRTLTSTYGHTYANREPSGPVQVPTDRSRQPYNYVEPSAPPFSAYYGIPNPSHLARPPRLPLPIGDSTIAPASPIIPPADVRAKEPDLDDLDPSLTNIISPTNLAGEDEEVSDELQPYAVDSSSTRVPMKIKWRGKGQRVYVTGTFVNWEKKFKLLKTDGEDEFSTVIQLRPGTHHLKFIIDGDMRISDDLPTAVDFMNILVNYIEVGAGDILQSDRHEKTPGPPVPPGGVVSPPALIESDVKDYADSKPAEVEGRQRVDLAEEEEEEEMPKLDFCQTVPQFLVDADREDEESDAYQRAADIIEGAPAPPTLPQFLAKSILNAATASVKDDNSVLSYPNHTVLNHLATSSIKNGVLATSVTTRYKRKYVTSIMYKPTGDITG